MKDQDHHQPGVNTMNEPKLGDRVRVNVPGEINHGALGVVIDMAPAAGRLKVDLGHIAAWYSPRELEPPLPDFVRPHRLARRVQDDLDLVDDRPDAINDADAVTSWTGLTEEPRTVAGPNDWSALIHQPETFHRPVIELDVDAVLDGGRLYLDRVLTWSQYTDLLDALAEAGVIHPGYLEAAYAQGWTAARLPWVAEAPPAGPDPERG